MNIDVFEVIQNCQSKLIILKLNKHYIIVLEPSIKTDLFNVPEVTK